MDKRLRQGIAISGFFTVAAIFFALIPASSLAAPCPVSFSKLRYSASFELKNANPTNRAKTNKTKMTLEIGSVADADQPEKWVAQISSGTGCQAICRTRRITSQAISPAMDLDCRAAGLDALSVPASLIFSVRAGATPVLRFGSWLRGYREAPLHVEVDQLGRQRNLAQVP